MTKIEALKLCEELWTITQGPGPNTLGLTRARVILDQLCYAHPSDGYLSEKASDALHYLEVWLSPRKWMKWDSEHIRGIVNNDVIKVRYAVQSIYAHQEQDTDLEAG